MAMAELPKSPMSEWMPYRSKWPLTVHEIEIAMRALDPDMSLAEVQRLREAMREAD